MLRTGKWAREFAARTLTRLLDELQEQLQREIEGSGVYEALVADIESLKKIINKLRGDNGNEAVR